MDVKCPRCQTVYHLDENHITNEGVSVKCTACQNIFKVSAPSIKTASQVVGWHLKRPDGSIINFAHLGELQKLILEHRAHLEDMISKDGLSYKKLADMPEFAPLFIKRNQQATSAPIQEAAAPEKSPQQAIEPKLSTPPVQSVVTPISLPKEEDEDLDIYGRPRKKGKKGGVLVAVGIILHIIALGAIFMLKDKIFGVKLTEEEASAVKSANDEMLYSDYANLEKAYDILEKYAKNPEHPPKLEVLATLSYALILRGELLKLENFVLEKRIKEILKVDKYNEVARKLNDLFNERQRLIQDLSNTTMTNLKRLDTTYGSKPLAKYVALEYVRVQVIFDRLSGEKGMALIKELKGIKDFVYSNRIKFIEGDLILKTDDSKSEEGLRLIKESALEEKGFVLPYFMLVRFYISKGEYEKAIAELDNILNIYPSNTVAKVLKEHTEDLLNISKTGQVVRTDLSKPDQQEPQKADGRKQNEEANKEAFVSQEKTKEEKVIKEPKVLDSKEKKEDSAVAKTKPEKSVASEPKSGGSYAQLIKQAKQFAAKGQIDKAADYFLQAAEIEPTLAEPFRLMGWMYIDAGKNEQAVNSFLRAIKLKGDKCDGYMGLGEANKFMKKNSEAKKYYQMYLEQCPNGPDAATARNNLNTIK